MIHHTVTLLELMADSQPLSLSQDLFTSITDHLTSVEASTWFWTVAALLLLSSLPKGIRWPSFIVAMSIALLPTGVASLVVLLVIGIVGMRHGLQQVPEGTAANVVRLGKYARTLGPGLHFIIPGLESIHIPTGLTKFQHDPKSNKDAKRKNLYDKSGFISTKEFMLDPPDHEMICSDNSVVNVDSIAYLRITSPKRAAFAVDDLGDSIKILIETVLRQEVGKLSADAVISARDLIGAKLQDALTIASEPWGTSVTRVEIQDIKFNEELQDLLTEAREAELQGRAIVVKAERSRDAVIAEAEGTKRRVELESEALLIEQRAIAEGEYLIESRKKEGEAAGLKAIVEALRDAPDTLVTLEAIKKQPEIAAGLAKSGGLLIVPNEAVGLIGSMASIAKAWDSIGNREESHLDSLDKQ